MNVIKIQAHQWPYMTIAYIACPTTSYVHQHFPYMPCIFQHFVSIVYNWVGLVRQERERILARSRAFLVLLVVPRRQDFLAYRHQRPYIRETMHSALNL